MYLYLSGSVNVALKCRPDRCVHNVGGTSYKKVRKLQQFSSQTGYVIILSFNFTLVNNQYWQLIHNSILFIYYIGLQYLIRIE